MHQTGVRRRQTEVPAFTHLDAAGVVDLAHVNVTREHVCGALGHVTLEHEHCELQVEVVGRGELGQWRHVPSRVGGHAPGGSFTDI